MKLEKWALLAEIIGSFAIVVTLVILIVEVRSNTEETRAATLADVAARSQAFPLANIENPQWADVLARAIGDEDLTASEQNQL